MKSCLLCLPISGERSAADKDGKFMGLWVQGSYMLKWEKDIAIFEKGCAEMRL